MCQNSIVFSTGYSKKPVKYILILKSKYAKKIALKTISEYTSMTVNNE